MVSKRNNFERIANKYKAIGKGNVRLTQSSLFLLNDISATRSQYDFVVLENDNSVAVKPKEIRLNQNDEFIVTSLGLYLVGRWGENTATVDQRPITLFTTAPIEMDGTNLQLNHFYDGKFRVAVNNIVYTEKWDLRRHQKTSITQMEGFLAGTSQATMPSVELKDDGMFNLSPLLTLSGAKKNELTLTLGNSIAPGTQISFKDNLGVSYKLTITEIALEMRGLLAQNAAKFQ